MYVCICHGVTDHKIRDTVAEGASTMRDLRTLLKVATCCGKCGECAEKVLNQALEELAPEMAA